MSIFRIDSHNNITALAGSTPSADATPSFSNAKELAEITAAWPASRLIETWNSFAGVAPFDNLKPVKKFTSRKAAIARIWRAVTRLSPGGAPPVALGRPTEEKAKKSSPKVSRRAPAKMGAAEPRSNKKAAVITMLRRAKGATLAQIMKTTGWQKHTVRGLVSILGSKHGLSIESSKNSDGERHYRITR